MRFMGLPAKALDVEMVSGKAGGLRGAPDVLGPGFGAADVDIAIGDVGHPMGQGCPVVGVADAVAEPGGGLASVSGQPDDLQAPLGGERVQFLLEQGTGGVGAE